MPPLTFDIEAQDPGSSARAGRVTTDHGEIETPIFMPVGTVGSVKAVPQRDLKETDQGPNYIGQYLPPVSPARHVCSRGLPVVYTGLCIGTVPS